jgi:hypothetical protein
LGGIGRGCTKFAAISKQFRLLAQSTPDFEYFWCAELPAVRARSLARAIPAPRNFYHQYKTARLRKSFLITGATRFNNANVYFAVLGGRG